jgi:Glycine zipper
MKRTLPFIAILMLLLAACQYRPTGADPNNSNTVLTDTTGLAQFQAWKAQNELKPISQYSGNYQPYQQPTKTVVYYVPQRSNSVSHYRTYSNSMTSENSHTARVVQRRGWSKAAKGTVIGAGGGAVLGALINKKNPLVGGIIGGVLGGAAGFGIGHHMDKVDGRY